MFHSEAEDEAGHVVEEVAVEEGEDLVTLPKRGEPLLREKMNKSIM